MEITTEYRMLLVFMSNPISNNENNSKVMLPLGTEANKIK